MKKNNFTKIMNKNLNEDFSFSNGTNNYFAYHDYLNKKRNSYKDKEIEDLKKELDDKEKEYNDKKKDEEENYEKVSVEINNYLKEFEDLQEDFFNEINDIEEDIGNKETEIEIYPAGSLKNKLKNEKRILENKKRTIKIKYMGKLRNLNNKLSSDAKKELKNMDSFMTKFDSDINLTESKLSYFEEKIIFGNILEDIEDITLLETPADPLTGIREKNNSAKQVNVAEKNAGAAQRRAQEMQKMKALGQATQTQVNQAKMDATAAELNKTKVDRLVAFKEAKNPIIDAKEKVIAAKEANIEKQKEAVENQKDQLAAIKAKQEQVSSSQKQKEAVGPQEVTQLSEEMDKTDDPKTKIDFNNFSATMFSEDHGKILKYIIRADSSGLKPIEITVANIIKNKPEAAEILKKLQYYINKASSGLSYEESLDLKAQKNAFKKIYEEVMTEYKNKYFGTYGQTPKVK